MDIRITELLEMAASEGFTLPYSPEFICQMEDAGHVVNLDTGAIVLGEANRPYRWELTEAGRAMARGGEV